MYTDSAALCNCSHWGISETLFLYFTALFVVLLQFLRFEAGVPWLVFGGHLWGTQFSTHTYLLTHITACVFVFEAGVTYSSG